MSEEKTYKPELLSRRGEFTAWVLSFVAALGLYSLGLRQTIPFWAWFLGGILAFSAASITLGNWMDRRTTIRLDQLGVLYENGLRQARLGWDDILEVRCAPARWGTSVQVIGMKAHFAFSTLGEMEFQGQVRGRTGFAEGKQVMDEIIRKASLTRMAQSGQFLTYSRP
jgi:hypothetical protein